MSGAAPAPLSDPGTEFPVLLDADGYRLQPRDAAALVTPRCWVPTPGPQSPYAAMTPQCQAPRPAEFSPGCAPLYSHLAMFTLTSAISVIF